MAREHGARIRFPRRLLRDRPRVRSPVRLLYPVKVGRFHYVSGRFHKWESHILDLLIIPDSLGGGSGNSKLGVRVGERVVG